MKDKEIPEEKELDISELENNIFNPVENNISVEKEPPLKPRQRRSTAYHRWRCRCFIFPESNTPAAEIRILLIFNLVHGFRGHLPDRRMATE